MPLASVKLAGGSEVTVVWARTLVAGTASVKTSAMNEQLRKRCEDIVTCLATRTGTVRVRGGLIHRAAAGDPVKNRKDRPYLPPYLLWEGCIPCSAIPSARCRRRS